MALLESIMKAERPERQDTVFSVTMIHYSKLIPSVNNDYSIQKIEELANAILLAGGIKQNLLARKKAPDEYELIAGHRRRLAAKYLVEELGHEEFAMVPVHVEKAGDVMSEIQLIVTNSSARERSDYEKMVEVTKLTHLMRSLQYGSPEDKVLFEQIFGRDVNIGGRKFRKIVAEKLGLSETKVANLNNIERNLIPELKEKFQDGSLGVSAANAAASLPAEEQKELTQKEEIRIRDVKKSSVSESDTVKVDATVSESESERQEECAEVADSEEPEPLSAYGTLERVYPPDSLIATSGCEGGHDCFSCAMECRIRQKDRYCRQAPMGNPFPCTTMNVLELLREEMGDKCQFVNHDLAFHRQGDGEPDPCCEVCEELCGFRCGKAKNAEVQSEPEVVEAEFEEVVHENLYTPQYFLNKEQEKLNEMLEVFKDTPPDQIPQKLFAHQKIIVAALASMVCDLEEEELRKQLEEEKPQQPEFPQLKNNDQRAAFIDAYATWPIWIETRETGERYYRYELPDAAMVVKVYFHKCFDYNAPAGKWEDRFHDAWGNPEYYLVQDKKHFKDCQTNRSSLIDYLKNIQKERVRL